MSASAGIRIRVRVRVGTALLIAWIAIFLAAALLAQAEAQAEGGHGRLVFDNDDALAGSLTGLDTEHGWIEWTYPGSPSPFRFELGAVSHTLLRRSPALLGHTRPLFDVALTNGDIVTGVIESLDAENLVLELGLETPLTVKREHVHRLDSALNASRLLYDGPNEAGEWEVGYRGKNWQFDDGHLISESYSSTGRELNIPERARVEMDVSLRDAPTLNLFLCADNPRNGGDSYYYIQITPSLIHCQRYWRDHPRTYINLIREDEDAQVKTLIPGQDQLHVALEIDRPGRRLQLFLNGKLHARFLDPAPAAPQGQSLILASYGNGSVRVRALRVYGLDQLTSRPAALADGEMVVGSGDTLEGLVSIRDGRFQTANLAAPAPLEELRAARLSAPGTPPDGEALTFFLASGSRLRGDATLQGGAIQLQHILLGTLTLPLSALDGFVAASGDPPAAGPAGPSRVLFKNGDRLSGRLHAWEEDRGLEWRWREQAPALWFPARAAAEIHLQPSRPLPPTPVRIQLESGDDLPGNLEVLTPREARFTTSFSKPLTIPLPAVERLEFENPDNLIFKGPGALSEWRTFGPDADWSRDPDGALSALGTAGLGRELPLPARGRLDLEVAWTRRLDLALTLFAGELDRVVQPGTYRLHCENERITLHRGLSEEEVAGANGARDGEEDPLRNRRLQEQLERFAARYGGGASRRLGSPVPVPLQAYKTSRTITLCWSEPEAALALLVDGKLLRTWEDPNGFAKGGDGLVLQPLDATAGVRLLRLEIRSWNGILPEPPLDQKQIRALDRAVVRLRNQDQFLTGAVRMHGPGDPLSFDSEWGALTLPADRLGFIQFPPAEFPVPHRAGMVLDGSLDPGGFTRFYLRSIVGERLLVSSPYFGENVFDLGAFRKLAFDLQDRAFWDRQTLPWPHPIPLSMRAALAERLSQEDERNSSTEDLSRFNESVELDE